MDKYIISVIVSVIVILILLATGLYLVFHFLKKNEKGTVIARGSVTHPGGDVQGNLLNDVNLASAVKQLMVPTQDYRGISGLNVTWYRFTITFATSPKNHNYQVLYSDADQNTNTVAVNNIISIATLGKNNEDASGKKSFDVTVIVKDQDDNSQNNFGFDFVVVA